MAATAPGHQRASRVVRRHAHQGDVRRQLVERGGQDLCGRPLIGTGKGRIGHEHRVVTAHGKRPAKRLGGLLGSHRQVGHLIDGPVVDQAQRLLDGVLVERVDDGLDAGAVEAQVIGVALVGAGGRDLLDTDDDLHDPLVRSCYGPCFVTPAR